MTETTSEENLIIALSEWKPLEVPETEYRIYYDKDTRVCNYITTDTLEWPEDFPYIVVDRATYDSIEFSPHYRITEGNKVERIVLDSTPTKVLTLDSESDTKTIKDDNVFVVDENYSGDTDGWTVKTSK